MDLRGMNDPQQPINREIFIQQGPVDTVAGRGDFKIVSFFLRGFGERWGNILD